MKRNSLLSDRSADSIPPRAAEPSGLLDLRTFIVCGLSLMVALAAGAAAAMYAGSEVSSHKEIAGALAGFTAFATTFLGSAAGLNSLIKP